jgi:hypothetical protein
VVIAGPTLAGGIDGERATLSLFMEPEERRNKNYRKKDELTHSC